jgi:hypothetical protein
MAYEARFVFKPNPGADLEGIFSAMKQCAALWQKHGASRPRLWSVTAGELGNYVLVADFENAAAYAKVVDALSADPDFKRWQAGNVKTGAITWTRSNLLREIDLGT